MFGSEYLGTLTKIVSPMTTGMMLILIAICGLIGAVISRNYWRSILKKQEWFNQSLFVREKWINNGGNCYVLFRVCYS